VRRAFAALVLASALATSLGCDSLRRGANPEAPLWAKRPGGVLSVTRADPLTIDARVVDEPFEKGRPAIDPINRRVFIGSSDHGLYCLRAEDGTILWRFETLAAVQSEPLYDPVEDVVYFGSNDGALYKVTARQGVMLWRFMSAAEIERSVVLDKGSVYFVNANDTVVALEAKTGKMKWNQHRAPIGGMSVAGYAGPTVVNGKVYAAYSDGHVMAYDAMEGTEIWNPVDLSAEAEQASGYQVPKYFDVDTTPVFDRISAGPVVYVASYSGGVFALDADTGARVWVNERALGVTELVLWTQPAHPPRDGGPTVPARKVLLASSGTTGLWGLDVEEGIESWRKTLPEGGVSAPVPVSGAMLVSTTRYGLFLFSPLDGGIIDGVDMGTGFTMTPAAYGRRAYAMSNGGTLVQVQVAGPVVGGKTPQYGGLPF
jgi:outer membrane protein assembly factor BamB